MLHMFADSLITELLVWPVSSGQTAMSSLASTVVVRCLHFQFVSPRDVTSLGYVLDPNFVGNLSATLSFTCLLYFLFLIMLFFYKHSATNLDLPVRWLLKAIGFGCFFRGIMIKGTNESQTYTMFDQLKKSESQVAFSFHYSDLPFVLVCHIKSHTNTLKLNKNDDMYQQHYLYFGEAP